MGGRLDNLFAHPGVQGPPGANQAIVMDLEVGAPGANQDNVMDLMDLEANNIEPHAQATQIALEQVDRLESRVIQSERELDFLREVVENTGGLVISTRGAVGEWAKNLKATDATIQEVILALCELLATSDSGEVLKQIMQATRDLPSGHRVDRWAKLVEELLKAKTKT